MTILDGYLKLYLFFTFETNRSNDGENLLKNGPLGRGKGETEGSEGVCPRASQKNKFSSHAGEETKEMGRCGVINNLIKMIPLCKSRSELKRVYAYYDKYGYISN